VYGMGLPRAFAGGPELYGRDVKDIIPSNIDPSTISYVCGFLSALSHSSCLTYALQ